MSRLIRRLPRFIRRQRMIHSPLSRSISFHGGFDQLARADKHQEHEPHCDTCRHAHACLVRVHGAHERWQAVRAECGEASLFLWFEHLLQVLGWIAFGPPRPHRIPEYVFAVGGQPPGYLARAALLDRAYRIEDILRPDLGNRKVSKFRENIKLEAMKNVVCCLRLPLPEHGPVPLARELLERVGRDRLLVTLAFSSDRPGSFPSASCWRVASHLAGASTKKTSG